jgi:hypothetical protein
MTAPYFASPLEGEADRTAVGRGVSNRFEICCSPPSQALPLKGGGDASRHGENPGHG